MNKQGWKSSFVTDEIEEVRREMAGESPVITGVPEGFHEPSMQVLLTGVTEPEQAETENILARAQLH